MSFRDPPASASAMLGSQTHATGPHFVSRGSRGQNQAHMLIQSSRMLVMLVTQLKLRSTGLNDKHGTKRAISPGASISLLIH